MGHREHKKHAPRHVGCSVITASDTRTVETDESGQLIQELLRTAGHTVYGYRVIPDEPTLITEFLKAQFQDPAVQAVIINGGTGLGRRDSTFEAIDGLLEKRLDGFGELFRHLSYLEIGSSAMLSRATAGVAGGRIVFSVPGSVAAVRLAMEKLILPEVGHLVSVASTSSGPSSQGQ